MWHACLQHTWYIYVMYKIGTRCQVRIYHCGCIRWDRPYPSRVGFIPFPRERGRVGWVSPQEVGGGGWETGQGSSLTMQTDIRASPLYRLLGSLARQGPQLCLSSKDLGREHSSVTKRSTAGGDNGILVCSDNLSCTSNV